MLMNNLARVALGDQFQPLGAGGSSAGPHPSGCTPRLAHSLGGFSALKSPRAEGLLPGERERIRPLCDLLHYV